MALLSLLSALLLGPVGAILAIFFGWYARREITRSGTRRSGYATATAGVVLGAILVPAWGALLSYQAWPRTHGPEKPASAAPVPPPAEPAAPDPPAVAPPPGPLLSAPPRTHIEREGRITVVDLGKATPVLSEELARQRASASAAGETVLVMTTTGRCDPCRGIDRALPDPLMQTALARVRLVRVDIEVFRDDLDALRIPRLRVPGFFLLALDLSPRDGIDGGEWDADIAPNIAPVLGAFVLGKYRSRREPWRPVPGSGMAL